MAEWVTDGLSPSQLPRIKRYISQWRHRLRRLPILYRIAIGNGLIILLGAVGGTLFTRHLAREAADLSLILMFSGLGIVLTVIINYWIIKTALRPLYRLRRLVDRVQAGQAMVDSEDLLRETDPDVNQLAAALHSLVQQLEDHNLKLRALSERAINAQEEERRRIARGLHDDTAQALSMLIIQLERLEQNIPSDTWQLKDRLKEARQLTTRTLQDLRQVVLGLRPTILDDLGLVAAIRWYARSTLESNGVRVEFEVPDQVISLPARVETILFRIAQEAISNIVRHSETESAEISLRYEDNCTCLWVTDQGRGFDVARTSDRALELRRLGLLGIQERADLIGGEVMVDSNPGQGTRLRVCVPLPTIGGMDGKHPHPVS
jgi:two-component system sensor histidine kinase UhpB